MHAVSEVSQGDFDPHLVGPEDTPFPVAAVQDLPVHLQPLVQDAAPYLSADELSQVAGTIMSYKDVFTAPGKSLGRIDPIKHWIDTGPSSPIRQQPRIVQTVNS
jgi:hypothetical protein